MKDIALLLIISLACATVARALDADDFEDLVGYTVVACTHATGEMEGVDFDKVVKLDNGMVFEFQTYSYFYAYRPEVVVFASSLQHDGKSVTFYKLLIGEEDEVFDVRRVR